MTEASLRLFVYGTLKRGFANHRRYCGGVRSVEEAYVVGRLYQLPAGYPALVIPEANVLATASGDPLTDVETQDRFQRDGTAAVPSANPAGRSIVFGEVLTFDQPGRHLPPIDELEGFGAGRRSLYLRVLTRVTVTRSNKTTTAWLYITHDAERQGVFLPTCRWPE